MDLLRVQGRWAAASRLAYVRVITKSNTDVCAGEQLRKTAQNSFPNGVYFAAWEKFFDAIWSQHVNNVIKLVNVQSGSGKSSNCEYTIDIKGESQLIRAIIDHNPLISTLGGIYPVQ
jgi:hypothetical protein